jgi:hypothetical protein
VGVKNFLAWSLRLEAFEKFLTAGHISRTEIPLIVYKVI